MPVYFIRAGDDGPIKIGVGGDPVTRMANLQIGHHEPLTLLATLAGDAETEAEVHEAFARHRLRGEWFEPAPALLAFIAEHAQPFVGPAPKSTNEIAGIRHELRMNQSEFAALLEVHQSQVSRWERGEDVDIRTLYACRWLRHIHVTGAPVGASTGSNAASRVVAKFGGCQAVADILGIHVSRCYRWTYPKGERGGTGGRVPSHQQHQLLIEARKRGIDLSPADFFERPAGGVQSQGAAA